MYVAYARGNKNLKSGGDDIGQKNFYCGPTFTPEKTKFMKKLPNTKNWGEATHTYTLEFRSGE